MFIYCQFFAIMTISQFCRALNIDLLVNLSTDMLLSQHYTSKEYGFMSILHET